MLSRKDYRAFAGMVKDRVNSCPTSPALLCSDLAADNPRFDRERFLTACGIGLESDGHNICPFAAKAEEQTADVDTTQNKCPKCHAGMHDIDWGEMYSKGTMVWREGYCLKCNCAFREQYAYKDTEADALCRAATVVDVNRWAEFRAIVPATIAYADSVYCLSKCLDTGQTFLVQHGHDNDIAIVHDAAAFLSAID